MRFDVTIRAATHVRTRQPLPAEIEEYRDERWCREGTRQVETAFDAERFIEQIGFAACLTDSPPAGTVALRGGVRAARRGHAAQRPEGRGSVADVDAEGRTRQARQRVLREARARQGDVPGAAHDSLLPRDLGPASSRREASAEPQRAEDPARASQGMGDCDSRPAGRLGRPDRYAFTTGLDELQAAMLVVPSEVYYQPKFTYIWTLGVGRFPDALTKRVRRETALREIARAFSTGRA